MPISDEALQSPKNSFLAVSGNATVGQAIAALHAGNGQTWWHLVVRKTDGNWGVIRFSSLYEELATAPKAAEMRLGKWPGLPVAKSVEWDELETRPAQELARKSPGSVLVVTRNNVPVGILVEGGTRGKLSISAARLGDLGGKYVNLKDYGSILLSSSGTLKGQKKASDPSAKH